VEDLGNALHDEMLDRKAHGARPEGQTHRSVHKDKAKHQYAFGGAVNEGKPRR